MLYFGCFVCMHVYTMCGQDLWNWEEGSPGTVCSQRQLWAAMGLLRMEPGSSARASTALNIRANFLAPCWPFLKWIHSFTLYVQYDPGCWRKSYSNFWSVSWLQASSIHMYINPQLLLYVLLTHCGFVSSFIFIINSTGIDGLMDNSIRLMFMFKGVQKYVVILIYFPKAQLQYYFLNSHISIGTLSHIVLSTREEWEISCLLQYRRPERDWQRNTSCYHTGQHRRYDQKRGCSVRGFLGGWIEI